MNKKRIAGFNLGQFGDLIVNLIPLQSLRLLYPDCHFSFSIARKYAEMAQLFKHHPYINDIVVWDGYDEWPNDKDKKILSNFDFVFNGMPVHPNQYWYTAMHITSEACCMHGLPVPIEKQYFLNKWFDIQKYENVVAMSMAMIPGNKKSISLEKTQRIVNYICSLGYKVLYLCGPNENIDKLQNVYSFRGPYFDAIRHMLGCKFLVTVDTGLGWVASAYQFPTLSLYSYGFFPFVASSVNWQPLNKNGNCLEADWAENIPDSIIYQLIETL